MKWGNIVGTPEEIKDFFENSGLNLADYLEKPKPKLGIIWFIFPIVLIILSVTLMFFLESTPKVLTFFFILGLAGATWLATNIQIHFNNFTATIVLGLGILLVLLISAGLLEPIDTIKFIKELRNK